MSNICECTCKWAIMQLVYKNMIYTRLKIPEISVRRELWILHMKLHKTYRLYSYPAWRDILRGRCDKLSASTRPGFVRQYSSSVRHTKSEANLTKFEALKKYRATRPTAGDKLGGVPLHGQNTDNSLRITACGCYCECGPHQLEAGKGTVPLWWITPVWIMVCLQRIVAI